MMSKSATLLLLCGAAALVAAEPKKESGLFAQQTNKTRSGKVFSLFNVVQFPNSECQTNSAISGSTTSSVRAGTCYTASQCQTLGGTSSGNCASGFGVCCLFTATASGSVVKQNCTYIRNPSFPTAYTDSKAITYTVNKVDNSVCFLRLDFISFTIKGTVGTKETPTDGVCDDTFAVTTNPKQNIPTICGMNTGQHMYVDMGTASGNTATLAFTFPTATTTVMRQWEIKATQVQCGSAAAPRPGCLQYVTGLSGSFTTFNYLDTKGTHLQNQRYNYCIRQEEGYCCVKYTQCDPSAFSLSSGNLDATMAAMMPGLQDASCTLDYIGIAASTGDCNQSPGGSPLANKYCGPWFNAGQAKGASAPVCDCTKPFAIEVFTDGTSDANGGDNTGISRGTCLNWMQIACN